MKEVRKNKVCACPTLGAPFVFKKNITKCVRSKPSRTSSHRSIRTIDAPAKTLESKAKNAPFLNLKHKSFIFTSRSSWISQGGLGTLAYRHVATRQVRARTRVNEVPAFQCNGTREHGIADMHQVMSSALNTTGTDRQQVLFKHVLGRAHVGHVCSDIGKWNMVRAILF